MSAALDYLARHREVLLADLEGLPEEVLHWRASPETLPISRSLQHVAAFELVFTGSLAWPRSREASALWPLVRDGFGPGRATGGWRDQLEMLAAVRAQALEWLAAATGVALAEIEPRPLLISWGAEAAEADRVARALARDLRVGRGLPLDPVRTLTEHEAYHRGQITLLKHLWTRQVAPERR